MSKKLILFSLLFTLVLCVSFVAAPSDTQPAYAESPKEEKSYCTATLAEDFAEDRILDTLS